MRKQLLLGALVLALPQAAGADIFEGHFGGRADHSGGTPGVYVVGETYDVYLVMDPVLVNPWYPWDTNLEYTVVFSTTVATYDGISDPRTVTWNDASVSIYEDDPGGAGTAADFASKPTFSDGLAILTGTISNMAGENDSGVGQPWRVTGVIDFTGGAGIDSLASECDGGDQGGMFMNDFINFQNPPGAWPDGDGYEEGYDAKWECFGTISVEPSTWGRVKGGYR